MRKRATKLFDFRKKSKKTCQNINFLKSTKKTSRKQKKNVKF